MKTKKVKVGKLAIGGDAPISVQSMCNVKGTDAIIKQIHELEQAGCEIVRIAVPDMDSAQSLKSVKQNISIPLVADIHFDYRLAIEAAKYADKIRINPGNIGSEDKIKQVIDAARENSVPIRIGVNLGSLEPEIEKKFGLTAEAMVESAARHISILEKNDFFDTVVSLKSSDILKTVKANRIFSQRFSYPLHLGITEAGSAFTGSIGNAVGLGILLEEGIGNTIRVSLAANPVEEVRAGWEILKALDLRQRGVKLIACPTCARANIDVASIAKEIEEKTLSLTNPIKIAVMGCAVNGPGEAKHADIGIVGGKDKAILYEKGELISKIEKTKIIDTILKRINQDNA